MPVWKCSVPNCVKEADVMAVGTTFCKDHGGQIAGLLNALMMTAYQKETVLGLEEEEKKQMQRAKEEEEKKKAPQGKQQARGLFA